MDAARTCASTSNDMPLYCLAFFMFFMQKYIPIYRCGQANMHKPNT